MSLRFPLKEYSIALTFREEWYDDRLTYNDMNGESCTYKTDLNDPNERTHRGWEKKDGVSEDFLLTFEKAIYLGTCTKNMSPLVAKKKVRKRELMLSCWTK